jgi:hypothetical protein
MFKIVFVYFDTYNVFFKSSGFALSGLMSTNIVVGTMMIILGILWSLISVAAILLTIRVQDWLPLFE